MIYQNELLMEQHVAQLRQATESHVSRDSGPINRSMPIRAGLGRALVRLGDRLAQPAGVPAQR